MKTLMFLLGLLTLAGCGSTVAPTPAVPPNIVVQPAAVNIPPVVRPRYTMHKTQNVWNLLLLDTRVGQVFQVQFSLESKKRFTRAINVEPMVSEEEGYDGRFTLTVTDNIWNSILLDTKTGNTWQCQFTLGTVNNFCEEIQ